MADFPLLNEASLVMIPGATKEGKVYSQVPTDGSGDFTFTRSTSATRVNEAGNIEKGYENLLLQSNSFDTTWQLQNGADITPNHSGYDGTNDAWYLYKNTGTTTQLIKQSISSTGVQTFSFYAKAEELEWVRLLWTGSTGGRNHFHLVGDGDFGVGQNIVSRNIEAVGNGWYKCSTTINDSVNLIQILPASGDNNVSGTTGGIYIQDAQLNQGLVAYPYLETTTAPVYGGLQSDQPRLDYTDATCPSLLLEESRTNLFNHSEYINNSSTWATDGCDGFLTTDVLSPEGKYNAIEIIQDTSFGNHWIRQGFNTSVSGGLYTQSVYLKRKNRDNVTLRTLNTTPAELVSFNLFDGTHNGGEHWFIKDAGDGWYRCGVTSTQYTGSALFYIYAGGSGNYTGDGITGVYAYGAQAEQGSYPSSYIPTYGSAQTRAAETTTSTFNSSSTGTISVSLGKVSEDYFTVLGESFEANATRNDIAIAYSPTALKVSLNGAIVVNATGTYDTSSLSSLQLGHDNGSDQLGGGVENLIMFNDFLTDTELNAITV